MAIHHLLLGVVEAVCWYFFFWYLVGTIRKPERNLWVASLVLLVLFYSAFAACPWLRHTDFWNNLGQR